LAYKNQAEGMQERFSQNFNKLFYSIGEVADLLNVNASLIRFWEKEFDAIKPKKNAKGNRKFTPKDIEVLQRIYDLVKVKGFTLEGAKKALSSKNTVEEDDLATTQQTQKETIDLVLISTKLLAIREKLKGIKVTSTPLSDHDSAQ
jgi:DNA-binding transcriptional MerR regulator